MTTSIPVIILTGHLGAGKTTLLNHLLTQPPIRQMSPSLMINEFGTIGIDGSLIDPGDSPIYEINKGSLFCICTKTDFIRHFTTIAEDGRTGLVLAEATGVAEPRDIEQFFDEPTLNGRFHIRCELCLIDALHFTKVAPMLKAARQQAARADLLVINKVDLVTDKARQQLRDLLTEMNPHAPILDIEHGRVPLEPILSATHQPGDQGPASCSPQAIVATSRRYDRPIARETLNALFHELGDRLLRFKGNVAFQDGPCFLERVFDTTIEKPLVDPLGPGSVFSAIAWQMDKQQLDTAFDTAFRA